MIYRLKDLISETEPKVAMSGQFHAMFSKYIQIYQICQNISKYIKIYHDIQSKKNSDASLYLAGWHGGYYLSPQNFTKCLKCKQIWKQIWKNNFFLMRLLMLWVCTCFQLVWFQKLEIFLDLWMGFVVFAQTLCQDLSPVERPTSKLSTITLPFHMH